MSLSVWILLGVSPFLLLFHGYYFCFISACNSACLFKPVHYDMCIPVTIHTNTCCHTWAYTIPWQHMTVHTVTYTHVVTYFHISIWVVTSGNTRPYGGLCQNQLVWSCMISYMPSHTNTHHGTYTHHLWFYTLVLMQVLTHNVVSDRISLYAGTWPNVAILTLSSMLTGILQHKCINITPIIPWLHNYWWYVL